MKRISIGLLVVAIVALLLPGGAVAAPAGGPTSQETGVSAEPLAASSLSIEISDLFNVSFREYWDWRGAFYGDLPVGATCFSFESIPGGSTSPNPDGTGACDVAPAGYTGETWMTYPYMNWYPWYLDASNSIVYAPYRMRVTGSDQPGSTLLDPVILPVFDPSAAPGSTLQVFWDYRYILSTEVAAVDSECGSNIKASYDGFVLENTIIVAMDIQESRRIFGVTGDPVAWWAANADPSCRVKGPAEGQWEAFMARQGGNSGQTAGIGPYDIASGFEWWYVPFATNFDFVFVDPAQDVAVVAIRHWSWGTEALLSRWFYWGSTPYVNNAETYPHQRSGWWPWELVWLEDFHFETTIGPQSQNIFLQAAVQYHLVASANAGPDGSYDPATDVSPDDFATWVWQPTLADYIYGGTATSLSKHVISELDPYAGLTYVHSFPGSVYYGRAYKYEYVPVAMNLAAGDTVTISLPTGDLKRVKFFDPASPRTSVATDLRVFDSEIGFFQSTPALPAGSTVTDSDLDGIPDTVTIVGPVSSLDWGAPDMPLVSYPVLEFNAQTPPPPPAGKADLTGRSAWPAFHHLDKSARGATQTLYALATNLGNVPVAVEATWEVRDASGVVVATVHATDVLGLGEKKRLSATLDVDALEGRFVVTTWLSYDTDGDGVADTRGVKTKLFSFAVVP